MKSVVDFLVVDNRGHIERRSVGHTSIVVCDARANIAGIQGDAIAMVARLEIRLAQR
jgi:hypothetical protein